MTTSLEHQYRASSRSILDAIGNTPLLCIEGIWCKLEFLNPSGSIKARVAKYIIERAEAEGLLHPGDTIVEATSGNTGNALAMVAAVKGYDMLVVMPSGLTEERAAMSRAFGARVELRGDFHVDEALAYAAELGSKKGYFSPRQFESEWNVDENREWLGAELCRQLPADVVPQCLVMGIGTGGTLIGVGQALRARNEHLVLVGVEPEESRTIACGEVGRHRIEGISDGFVPGIFSRHRHEVESIVSVSSEEALDQTGWLARHYGLFVGPSSGANFAAARSYLEQHPGASGIVTLFCDEGEKYLSDFDAGLGAKGLKIHSTDLGGDESD